MSGTAKVVPLKSKNQDYRAQAARLPAPVHQLQDKGKQLLLGLLRRLFDNADDALFELADKAASNQDQNLYFDSMREVRIRRRAMEADFGTAIDKAFALLANQQHAAAQADADDAYSLDNLSLVQNEELEQLVATDGMIAKASERHAEPIQHLTLRLDSLVPVKVYPRNNPFGPDVVCRAFADTAQELAIDIKAKLVLFKLFDNYVVAHLGKFYQALNNALIEQNILPSLRQRSRRRPGSGRAAPPPAAQRQAPPAQSMAPAQDAAADNEILHTLRGLLANQRGDTAPGAAPAAGPALGSGDLIGLLSGIQSQQLSSGVAGGGLVPQLQLRQLLQQLLQSQDRQQNIGQVDDDVINLVNMMFEFILDDRNLAEPMKGLIARLQIPIIKVAISDKSFFNKGGHPARRLLNELATAGLGWQDDGQRQDPLYRKVESIVQRILGEFGSDVELFAEVLADFVSFVEKEKRRATLLEQRTIDAEDGKAKAEVARARVTQALSEKTDGLALPPVVEKLLRDAWSNVLFLVCLKQGTDSEDWKDGLQVVDDLIWSIDATPGPQHRQEMLQLVPKLLKRLRQGLESVSYNPFEMTQLFKQLEILHIAQLRAAEAPEPEPKAAEAETPVAADPAASARAEVSRETGAAPAAAPRAESLAAAKAAPASPAPATSSAKTQSTSRTESRAPAPSPSPSPTSSPAPAIPPAPVADSEPDAIDSTADAALMDALDAEIDAALGGPAVSDIDGDAEATLPPETPQAPAASVVSEHMPVSGEASRQSHCRQLQQIDRLTQGTWFEMVDENNKRYRCRLAAIIKPTGKYIFVNRSGVKVAEKTRDSLAAAMQSGALSLLDDGMLFDRALESVIGNLRKSRTSS
ncbi:DUF1631 domain-containing protein [Exilibacterium tricleocarpae]|uniref:DUF1631 domain-containing protein n=1 Tax=Exilibacterium tricleocarpae TaxID=2591008 RepID=A0A545TQG3_9GAMM|nr:DUF1631 domain-containing protein [Exilibacterium tricleocarpae]TQV79472.1 DUF1631 domain-containing protein [Exilibacterium tricleocarpae]